tara:strand:- start:495 stop:761 length:267 start_codon:yes stop_codon:yes gene_type:complete
MWLTFYPPDFIISYMIRQIITFWFTLLALIVLMTHGANANETLNEKVNNWFINEKNKTIEFQKESWSQGKDQLKRNWTQIKSFFTKAD